MTMPPSWKPSFPVMRESRNRSGSFHDADFEGRSIRMIEAQDPGNPFFVVADLAGIIGANPSRAVEVLDDDEKCMSLIHTNGGARDVVVMTESGLYSLVVRSKAAVTAGTVQHRFRRWLTGVVLPEIRRTGSYVGTPKSDPFGRATRNAIAEVLGRYDVGHLDRAAFEASSPSLRRPRGTPTPSPSSRRWPGCRRSGASCSLRR